MDKREMVYQIICDKLGVDRQLVNDEADLREDLGGDSLDIIEVVMEIESVFGVVVEDSVYDKTRTVGEIIKLVEKHDKG